MLSFLLLMATTFLSGSTEVNQSQIGLLTRSVQVGDQSYSYQVHIPARLPKGERPPVVLFLHGIGQRGTGGFVPTTGGMSTLIANYLERVPAILVLPQCRPGMYWSTPEMERMTIAALDDAVRQFGADPARVYLVGVSMGGYGAYDLAANHPHKFAALVSICGGSSRQGANRFVIIANSIKDVPVWIFHGARDRVVPVSESREMVVALKAVSADVRYSEYPEVGHNVWMQALAEPDLLPWLFAQRADVTAADK